MSDYIKQCEKVENTVIRAEMVALRNNVCNSS